MAKIKLSRTELNKTLVALGREGDSVYSARKSKGQIIIQFVGDRKETRLTLPKRKQAGKTTTEPVDLGSVRVQTGATAKK